MGNGRVIELKESAGALFARETSEWGFEEVFDLTTLTDYDSGVRAEYRINAGNIERREAQETAWEVVMAVADLAPAPVPAIPLGVRYYLFARINAWDSNIDDNVVAEQVFTNLPVTPSFTQSGSSVIVNFNGSFDRDARGPLAFTPFASYAGRFLNGVLTDDEEFVINIANADGTQGTKVADFGFTLMAFITNDPGAFTPAE